MPTDSASLANEITVGERPSVAVQIVVYNNEAPSIVRLVEGVAAMLWEAHQAGAVGECQILIGDSSEQPCFDDQAVAVMANAVDNVHHFPLDYVFFDDNLGSGGGSNRLAQESSSDLILVLNPDTYPKPDLLIELRKAIANERVAAVDARQIPIEHPKYFDPNTGECSWVSGCCMLIKRVAFDQVGGFDSKQFPMYCDDVDFSWKLRHAGFKVVHQPTAAVFHAKSLSIGAHLKPAATEQYWSGLARLLLTTKWGRQDLCDNTLEYLRQSKDEQSARIVAEYERRKAAGSLPTPVEHASRTAIFVGGEYSLHRWA
jgi:cellulose synthase/poly-beta-1,6-N-acetylglucosamine synthase-like glycosyltransferase